MLLSYHLISRCINLFVKTLEKREGYGPGGEVLPYITYTGMCRPTGLWFWSSLFRTGYPFQRRFPERGIIFRTQESFSLVSSYYLKLFKDRLLLKIRFNALTSKQLYSCCTLCFGCLWRQNKKLLDNTLFAWCWDRRYKQESGAFNDHLACVQPPLSSKKSERSSFPIFLRRGTAVHRLTITLINKVL